MAITEEQRDEMEQMSLVARDQRFKHMFAKALILPIGAATLLGASQFALAQSIQPVSPCPPGKVAAVNHSRGQQTANVTDEERRKRADSRRLTNKYDSGGGNTHTAPVAGGPIDPICR